MSALRAESQGRNLSARARLLIVEDDPNSRWVLAALLRRLGFDCQVATNGLEALRLIREAVPQLILMDLMMPELDGVETTRRLRADVRTRHVPILALTGDVTPSGEQAAREAGCDEFVPKPVVFQDLLDRIERRLDRSPTLVH